MTIPPDPIAPDKAPELTEQKVIDAPAHTLKGDRGAQVKIEAIPPNSEDHRTHHFTVIITVTGLDNNQARDMYGALPNDIAEGPHRVRNGNSVKPIEKTPHNHHGFEIRFKSVDAAKAFITELRQGLHYDMPQCKKACAAMEALVAQSQHAP